MNQTLKSIGLTKDQIAKMMGIQVMQDPPKSTSKISLSRKIDPSIAKAIINDKTGATCRELAKKHDVSVYYVWSVKNKHRNK
jgi:hypothetical protein